MYSLSKNCNRSSIYKRDVLIFSEKSVPKIEIPLSSGRRGSICQCETDDGQDHDWEEDQGVNPPAPRHIHTNNLQDDPNAEECKNNPRHDHDGLGAI